MRDQQSRRYAAALCNGCPVTVECLEYAVDWGVAQFQAGRPQPSGVWGGFTEQDRARLVQRRVGEVA